MQNLEVAIIHLTHCGLVTPYSDIDQGKQFNTASGNDLHA